MKQTILDAIVKELRRQSEADKAGTPYFDAKDDFDAIIDGEVNLDKLAEAIAKAVAP